jgi:hypothetical protein
MTAHREEELAAIQNVVDRVSSWQDGASQGTVEDELRKGFDEAGVGVADGDVDRLASAIEDEHGAIDAAEVLNR